MENGFSAVNGEQKSAAESKHYIIFNENYHRLTVSGDVNCRFVSLKITRIFLGFLKKKVSVPLLKLISIFMFKWIGFGVWGGVEKGETFQQIKSVEVQYEEKF